MSTNETATPATSLTVTRTRTHTVTNFANPYLTCDTCGRWITGGRNLGEHEGLVTLEPCGHAAASTSACPSWGPVDGCTCADVLGVVAHGEPTGTTR